MSEKNTQEIIEKIRTIKSKTERLVKSQDNFVDKKFLKKISETLEKVILYLEKK